jgi:hypothetical protein
MKKIGLFVALLSVSGCSESTQKSEFKSSIVANDENEQQLKESLKSVENEERERVKNSTKIAFSRTVHDYGKIRADADYTTVFVFQNTGNKSLLVYDVKTSCGCTVPTWNKNPIAPGAKDQIEVTFHPKEHQIGLEQKTVTVMTNTVPSITVLQIKANVSPKKK